MKESLADNLAKLYIYRLESGEGNLVCSLMDIFDSKKNKSEILNRILKTELKNISLNYQTFD